MDPSKTGSDSGPSHQLEDDSGVAVELSDFYTVMTQFYRGERGRATTWRTRLDHTTDWAVILSATLLTWAFSETTRPHYVILVGVVMVTLFLLIEVHRYRVFDVWRSRARLLEEHLFANVLDSKYPDQNDWRQHLANDLRTPTMKTPFVEATRRRLRRIYFPLLLILFGAWIVLLTVFEHATGGVIAAARIGQIPGTVVFGIVLTYYLVLFLLTVWPVRRHAKGEIETNGEWGDWKE
jgi:uncharacterized membrane protein